MSTKVNTLQNNFNIEYENTSPQERELINHTQGTVCVVTAPGSRITNLLATRIAKILSLPNVLPENILCLTATHSSAIAFHNKLYQLIGPVGAEVNVCTFHSFCEMVVSDNEAIFENKSLSPMSTLENIRLMKALITAFPKNHPLKRYRGDVFHEINNLQNLFSLIKREGLETALLIKEIDDYVAALLVGDTNDKERHMMEKLRAGINEFEHYQSLLRLNDRYDADDLVYLVTKALRENENLLSAYRSKFQYIQVDDVKITNSSLNLLQILAGGTRPNILRVVHDEQYFAGLQVNKKNNWMGSGNAHTITFPAMPDAQSPFTKPVVSMFHSIKDELAGITNQVYDLLQLNVARENIIVLYHQYEYCSAFEKHFALKQIPFQSRRNVNVLSQPFIHKIIQLLQYIHAEQDNPYSGDHLLFEILHFDFYSVPPFEIASLAVEVNSKKYSSAPTAIRKLLQERANAPAKDLFDTGLNIHLKEVSALLEKLIADADNISLQQLYDNLLQQALVLDYMDKCADGLQLKQLLDALSGFIKAGTSLNPGLRLNELMEVIDTMEKEKLPIAMQLISGSADGVRLMNMEEAKGQEAGFIFFTGANTVLIEKPGWFNCICKLPHANYFSSTDGEQQASALRLLLNATQADNRPHLSISFAKYNPALKELMPASFVTAIISQHSISVATMQLKDDERKDYSTLYPIKPRPAIAQPVEALIIPLVKKFVMNVSALNSYLSCPLGFYYKNILRIPTGYNEAMEFGSAVHYTLENLFKKMLAGLAEPAGYSSKPNKNHQFPSAAEMVEDFKAYMQSNRTHFSKEAFNRRIQYGEETLLRYYEHYSSSWNKVVSIERNIRGITVNGVPLKGKIDKLEFNGREVNIVDYKSGDIEKALPKLQPPNEDSPNGGDYWRQAVFYTILINNYRQKDWHVTGAEFDFTEPDSSNLYRKEKITAGPADIATVQNQLTHVWQQVQARGFYTGCGKADCHWCNFVKDNKLAVAVHN